MPHSPVLWQQAGNYPAQSDRQLLGALWPGGGVLGGAVTAVANTMTVSVAAGSAAVPLQAGQGSALCHWDTPDVVTIPAAPPSGQSRIDVIAVLVRDAAIDGGANNDFVIEVIGGTPATLGAEAREGDEAPEALATVPAVPANALAIAQVTVPGAAANLNGATVTDMRVAFGANLAVPQGRMTIPTHQPAGSGGNTILGGGSATLRGGMGFANNGLVVPVAGVYRASVGVTWEPGGPSAYYTCGLAPGGAPGPAGAQISAAIGSGWALTFTDELAMTAGQALQVYAYQNSGAGQWVGAGWLALSFVSTP